MHDQQQQSSPGSTASTSSSNGGGGGGTSPGGSTLMAPRRELVAARLKRNLPGTSSGSATTTSASTSGLLHVQNGAGVSILDGLAHDDRCENGSGGAAFSAESSNNTTPTTLQLSETDKQLVRLIGQHLKSLGFKETVNKLIQESGCHLENMACTQFRNNLLAGEWDLVLTDLKQLAPYVRSPHDLNEMRFLLLEQKYLELLEKGNKMEALQVLRYELSTLDHNYNRVHQLSTFLVANPTELTASGWQGSSVDARQHLLGRLQAFIPAEIMLPPRRLEILLEQAIQWQYSQCSLHNAPRTNKSGCLDPQCLFVNHQCNQNGFPCEARQILTDHSDEVWCVCFSHNGRFMATGSKEATIFVYEVDQVTKTLRKFTQLNGPGSGTSFAAWSHDNKYLAAVGPDGPELYIFNVPERRLHKRIIQSAEDQLAAVSWHSDSKRVVSGGTKGQFYVTDVDGQVLDSWEGIRVRALCCKRDGTILAADTHNRIRSYEMEHMTDTTIVREDASLIYFSMDKTERYALCTTKDQGLHLWDLDARQLIRKYRGSRHGDCVVVSCFGGEEEKFVASGSEDGNVYVWHADNEHPVKVLTGHTGVANAVAWNPHDSTMLVSCGDDGTVRVWGPSSSHPTVVGASDSLLSTSNSITTTSNTTNPHDTTHTAYSGNTSSGNSSLCC